MLRSLYISSMPQLFTLSRKVATYMNIPSTRNQGNLLTIVVLITVNLLPIFLSSGWLWKNKDKLSRPYSIERFENLYVGLAFLSRPYSLL